LTAIPDFLIRLFRATCLPVILLAQATAGMAQDAPIVQPGAPGNPARQLSAEEATEIAAAAIANQGSVFNPQTQFSVTWPAEPVVARAYVDQLQRGNGLSPSLLADVNTALERSAARLDDGASDKDLADGLANLSIALQQIGGDSITSMRRAALAETLDAIADRLR
jgi:hypothetical protein